MCEVKKVDAARGIFCLEAQSHSRASEVNSFQISTIALIWLNNSAWIIQI